MSKNKENIVKFAKDVALKSDTDLLIREDKHKGIITYGKDNKYPGYLLSLYKGQPQHKNIVKGKSRYLTGLSLYSENRTAAEWLKKANPKQSWYKLSEYTDQDQVIFGAFAIKVVPSLAGIPLWHFHVNFACLRPDVEEGYIQYCDDWEAPYRECEPIRYPIWYPGCKTVSIYVYKNYNPAAKKLMTRFPGIEYDSGIKSIDTLVRIQNYKNSLVSRNFSSGVMVQIFGTPKTPQEEQYIADRLNGNHTGDEAAGNTLVTFTNNPDSKPINVQTIDVGDLDKKFEGVTKSETVNVYAAHGAPPDLFNYISDTSSLFEDKNKIVAQNEYFMNSYVIPSQKHKLNAMAQLFKAATGQEAEFEVEQFDPVGLDLPIENQNIVDAINKRDPNAIPNWIAKKYKLDYSTPDQAIDQNLPATIQQAEVNDHLKNLTGKQSQGIMRIVRKYNNGEYSEGQAMLLLKGGFGLTDSECKEFLGITQSAVPIQQRIEFAKNKDFFALFDKYAHDVIDDDVLEVEFVGHVAFGKFEFAVDVKTRTAILNLLKGNSKLTDEQLAAALGINVKDVESSKRWLEQKGLVEFLEGEFNLTKKGREAKKTVIYTEYNYDLRPDLKAKGQPVFLSTSRQWCRDFYAKFGVGKKALTFEAIDAMSNEFGENVWDYRGGWYGDEPFCRHGFVGVTKVRYE